jgi:hypothetical protein
MSHGGERVFLPRGIAQSSAANAEFAVSLDRPVALKNIRTSDTYNPIYHSPEGFWDIYGSNVPFTNDSLWDTTEGEKIGEFNRSDIFIHARAANKTHWFNGMNSEEPEIPPGDTNDIWNPLVSPSGWHKIPVGAINIGDTTQFVANATIV